MTVRRALLFPGQGSHKRGMGLDLIADRSSAPFAVWARMQEELLSRYRFNVTTAIRDDPNAIDIEGQTVRFDAGGVMRLTYIAQPAMVTYHQAAFAALRTHFTPEEVPFDFVAGHSLGEFSALTALGIFTPEKVATLVYRRGRIMVEALASVTTRDADPLPFPLFAVSASRARLVTPAAAGSVDDAGTSDDPDAALKCIIGLVSEAAAEHYLGMLELVNHNCRGDQTVVAGDRTSLSALGKCLDPQWRATVMDEMHLEEVDWKELVSRAVAEALEDIELGVSADPNKPLKPFYVPGSRKRTNTKVFMGIPVYRSIDGGGTPSEEELASLSRQGDGRSGMNKRSWFLPLDLRVPFHSSALRLGVDPLYTELDAAVPSSDRVLECLCREGGPRWLCNVTGTPFDPSAMPFRDTLRSVVLGENIGERSHLGKALPRCTDAMLASCDQGDPRGMVITACAIQLTRTVQWAATMDYLVTHGVRQVVEVSPVPTLCGFVRKSPPAVRNALSAACFPADLATLKGWFAAGGV